MSKLDVLMSRIHNFRENNRVKHLAEQNAPTTTTNSATTNIIEERGWPLLSSDRFDSIIRSRMHLNNLNMHLETGNRKLKPHQAFVRTFLGKDTPYRGLILYHGLGSGKTCAAIAAGAAEATTKKMVVLLPASLEANFKAEVEPCGGESLNIRYIRYNGLSDTSVDKLLREHPPIFDDAVIAIDEAHNFVQTASNGGVVQRVYEAILKARRCRVMLLSGTPLVNSAHEVALLLNLVDGYKREYTVPLSRPLNQNQISALSSSPVVQSFTPSVVGRLLRPAVRITLVPEGFRIPDTDTKRDLVVRSDDGADRDATDLVATALQLPPDRVEAAMTRPVLLKPLSDDRDEFEAVYLVDEGRHGKKKILRNLDMLENHLRGRVSFFEGHDASVYPTLRKFAIVRTHLSSYQFAEYGYQRAIEVRREKNARLRKGDEDSGMGYRPFTRAVCNFAFPHDMQRPYRTTVSTNYEKALETAVQRLIERPEQLRPKERVKPGDSMNGIISPGGREYTLEVLSSKFARVLEYILSGRGGRGERRVNSLDPGYPMLLSTPTGIEKHTTKSKTGGDAKPGADAKTGGGFPAIVYSQFRAAEGIAIFGEVLRANGFGEIQCFPHGSQLRLRRVPPPSGTKDIGLSFITFSSDQSSDRMELLLSLFNNRISELPLLAREDLGTMLIGIGLKNATNARGEIAAVLLISKSGSEGISTRNVRAVHVLEPFWHANRIEQVVGRARRAYSHDDLLPQERTVDVYVHMSTFSRDQVLAQQGNEEGTADEFVHAVAQRKRQLLKDVRKAMRLSSIDVLEDDI